MSHAPEEAEAMTAETTLICQITVSSEHLPYIREFDYFLEPRNRRLKGHQRHEKRPFYHGVRRK